MANKVKTQPGHEHGPCVFVEADFGARLRTADYIEPEWNIDTICEQLCADRWGYGINGKAITRRRP